MKNTFTILAALFAVCVFVGSMGCDNKKDGGEKEKGHVHGPDCNHDHGHVHGPACDHDHGDAHDHDADEPAKDENALPDMLPEGVESNPFEDGTEKLPDAINFEDAPVDPAAEAEVDAALDALTSETTAGVSAGDTAATAYAPVEVTTEQLTAYVDGMEKYVADAAEFADNQPRILRDAHTIIALALVLGLHDQPNAYKSAAPAIIKAAQATATSADYAAAKTNIAALKTALKSTEGGLMNWDAKVASMKQLMVQVPLLDGRIKTGMRRLNDKTKAALAGQATTIAVLCQASIPYVADTEAPAEEDKWVEACLAGRDAAASLATALSAGDKTASQAAYDAMAKTCDKCHETFHKAALPK